MRGLRVWNVKLFEEKYWLEDNISPEKPGTESHLLALAVSADGRFVGSGNQEGMIWLWNAPMNAEIRRFVTDGTGLTADAVSVDGRYLLTGCRVE